VHGLDRCPDRGIEGFKRYVALAVVARNIHRIGAILWQREQEARKVQALCASGQSTKWNRGHEPLKEERLAA
jgi:hypothetical protein